MTTTLHRVLKLEVQLRSGQRGVGDQNLLSKERLIYVQHWTMKKSVMKFITLINGMEFIRIEYQVFI